MFRTAKRIAACYLPIFNMVVFLPAVIINFAVTSTLPFFWNAILVGLMVIVWAALIISTVKFYGNLVQWFMVLQGYQHTIADINYELYTEKVEELKEWLDENKIRYYHKYNTFYFLRKEDLMAFKLKV